MFSSCMKEQCLFCVPKVWQDAACEKMHGTACEKMHGTMPFLRRTRTGAM